MADLHMTFDGQVVVAVVFDDEGNVQDYCYNWESGQNYALSIGLRVVAIDNDGAMTIQEAQKLYDAERDRYNDCFGVIEKDAPPLKEIRNLVQYNWDDEILDYENCVDMGDCDPADHIFSSMTTIDAWLNNKGG